MDATVKYQVMGVLGLGGLGGVLAYFLRAKVDIWRASQGAEINLAHAPMNVLLTIVQNKEKENTELRADMKLILTNHLEHDAADRQAVTKALIELAATQRELIGMIREDRTSSAEQRASIHERITQLAIQKSA